MTKAVERYACLTFHAERLHDDRVWESVRDIVEFLDSKDIPATWFSIAPVHSVYLSRQFSPDKWSQRLKELSSRNQLIEQHTHFYKETKGPYDLSWANLEKRLLEDRHWLESQGFKVNGFVAGGWAINKELLKLLVINDYLYDCTIATFKSNYINVMAAPYPVKFPLWSKFLIEIPTSHYLSLKEAFSIISPFGRDQFVQLDESEFCVVYLHDWDLTKLRNRSTLKIILNNLRRKAKFVTTRHLAKYLGSCHLPSIDLEEK